VVKLDILSDPICPWCYIGKANLDRALARAPNHPFEIEWHPFQLNPEMPREGADCKAFFAARFGSPAQIAAMQDRVATISAEAGLAMNLDAIERIPNTLDAHRLIHWGGIEGKQSIVVSALFRANFVEGRDISDHEVLADIADSAGLDAALVARLLATNADIADIRARDAHSRKMGISAVPTFIVAQSHAVPGAQSVEMWDRVIADINANTQSAGEAS
jgi:predicted DsbA family dithiol-disulfide isomerase